MIKKTFINFIAGEIVRLIDLCIHKCAGSKRKVTR